MTPQACADPPLVLITVQPFLRACASASSISLLGWRSPIAWTFYNRSDGDSCRRIGLGGRGGAGRAGAVGSCRFEAPPFAPAKARGCAAADVTGTTRPPAEEAPVHPAAGRGRSDSGGSPVVEPAGRMLALASWLAALAAVATRWPFAARRLWDHDSIQFALGVEKYDLAAHHPHPPGYPLYIGILKVLAALGIDALHGMVALSILAAALGAGLIVPLTARLAAEAGLGRDGKLASPLAAGVLAAALFVFNPLLWFYGELPLVYAVEGGMTVALAYAALRMGDSRAALLVGCAAFALAGGIRPSTLVLLLPLFLLGVWRAWRRGAGWPRLLGGALVAVAVGLAWLVPLLAAAGGLAAYRRINAEHFSALLPYTSVLYGAGPGALAHNLTIMTKWFLQGLLPAAAALGALAALHLLAPEPAGGGRFHPWRDGLRLVSRAAPFLAAWMLPPVAFFLLFHITKAGYTLVYLPALLVAASLFAAPALAPRSGWAARAATTAPGQGPRQPERPIGLEPLAHAAGLAGARTGLAGVRTGVAVVMATAVGAGLFLFGADRRPDQPRALAIVRNEFNRGAIATYERDLDRLVATLRAFPPGSTVLATVELSGTGTGGPEAFLYPWQRHLQWYLPACEVLHLVPEDRLAFVARGHQPFRRTGPVISLPPGTQRLAIVLSGPTGARFPLAWPIQPVGATFDLVIVPVAGRLRLGPFTFEAAPLT
jgi:hypothetical protein